MLDVMRRSANSWVVKGPLVLLALSFIAWGTGGMISRPSGEPVVEVGRHAVSPQEFSRAYTRETQQFQEMTGGKMDKRMAEMFGIKQQTLIHLVNHYLLLSFARDLRLAASPETLRREIATNPAFAENGRFSQERYTALLRNNRMTPKEYESQLQTDLIKRQIEQIVGIVMQVPDLLVEDAYQRENEKRVVTIASLDAAALASRVQADDGALSAFLSEKSEQFMTPLRVKVRYVLLDGDSVRDKVKVSPEEIKEYYEDHSADFQQSERRKVRHILARTEKGQEEAALAKIAQAQGRLQKGESFAQVAKALSEDVTAAEGGDLGLFARGIMVQPFDEAAFALPVGQVSAPVKSPFGYHLILVDEIQPERVQSMEEATPLITGQISERKSQDAAYERSALLEDQLGSGAPLQEIAKTLNLHYQETGLITRDEGQSNDVEGMAPFQEAAFTGQPGKISPLLELPGGRFVALEVMERHEPAPQPLAEIKETVRKAYIADKSLLLAREVLTELLKAVKEGKTLQEAVSASGAPIQMEKSVPFTATGREPSPSPAVRQAAFHLTMKHPLHEEIVENQTRLQVIQLEEVALPPAAGLKAQAATLRTTLEQELAKEQMGAFLQSLQKENTIRVHANMLDKF